MINYIFNSPITESSYWTIFLSHLFALIACCVMRTSPKSSWKETQPNSFFLSLFFNSHDNANGRRVPNYVSKVALETIVIFHFTQQEFSKYFFFETINVLVAAFSLGEVITYTKAILKNNTPCSQNPKCVIEPINILIHKSWWVAVCALHKPRVSSERRNWGRNIT